jgi:hypothetical protein
MSAFVDSGLARVQASFSGPSTSRTLDTARIVLEHVEEWFGKKPETAVATPPAAPEPAAAVEQSASASEPATEPATEPTSAKKEPV